MTIRSMYDEKLSDITESIVIWKKDYNTNKVIISFSVKVGDHYYWHERKVTSRQFSNHSVDTIRFNNKRYLIDSQVELVEAP